MHNTGWFSNLAALLDSAPPLGIKKLAIHDRAGLSKNGKEGRE